LETVRTAPKDVKSLEKGMVLASRRQIVKEAVDIATNTGSWVEGGNTQLGARPLDWKTNPESAAWLQKNASKLGIELPDELKAPVEAAKPTTEEMVPVYHGEGGAGGAGLGGFSVSESQKYAASFGPRQSVVEVPRRVLDQMKQDARNRGEPTNLILPEEYQKKLRFAENLLSRRFLIRISSRNLRWFNSFCFSRTAVPSCRSPAKCLQRLLSTTAPPLLPKACLWLLPVEAAALPIGQGPAMTRRASTRPEPAEVPVEAPETLEGTALKNAISGHGAIGLRI
jgi:hypothetical protein